MSDLAENVDRLLDLADAVCDEVACEHDFVELDAILRADQQFRNCYLDYCWMHVASKLDMRAKEAVQKVSQQIGAQSAVVASIDSDPTQVHVSVASALGFPATLFHSSVSFFSSGWPLAYLLATAILATGLLAAHWTRMSQPVPIAYGTMPTSGQALPKPDMRFVGRISGMIDCRWAGRETEMALGKRIPLGQKYSLASGLVEITYDTGAIVVLQGPVRYEIDSGSGGYLSAGKLTGRVEVEKAKGFAVRTPTAIVTDLGTEFGVEVSETGDTTSYVFVGSVAVQARQPDGRSGCVVRLHENQSAQVAKGIGDESLTVQPVQVDPTTFVRAGQLPKIAKVLQFKPFQHWLAYSQALRQDPSLLAYYDFQQKPGQPSTLPNVAINGDSTRDGVVENAIWTNGRMPGKHALLFNGPDDYVQINLPQETRDITLAAWVNIDFLSNGLNGLLMSDAWGRDGLIHWQLGHEGRMGFDVCGSAGRPTNVASLPLLTADRFLQWIHLAVVYDHTVPCVRFYVDGKEVGEPHVVSYSPISIAAARIGQWNVGSYVDGEGSRNFRGRIDELAIFGRPLKAEEIARMFEEGSVSSLKIER